MPIFEYKAINSGGAATMGKIEAAGRQDAARMIEAKGLTPLRLTETGSGVAAKAAKASANASAAKAASSSSSSAGSKKMSLFQSKKVSFSALEDFTRSLASLLAASVPLSKALTILYRECSSPVAGAKWRELHDSVVDGVSLADSMAKSPEVFPSVYVAMVEAGEAGGFLDVVLSQISDFQAREKEMKGKVSSAMIYPAVLLFLAIAVMIFLFVFFIPRFKVLFEGFNAKLPALTEAIVGISNAMQKYGLFMLIAVVALGYFGKQWFAKDSSKRLWQTWILKMPIIGPLAAQIAMARFCRMLGTLLGAGVSLINALSVARRSLGNQALIDLVTDSTERVKKGESLGSSLAQSRVLFGGSAIEMISVAEESGRLDQELVRLAGVTEITLDRQLKNAVSLAEPLMLFAIAGFIGTIFIGMVLPIFSIQDLIK